MNDQGFVVRGMRNGSPVWVRWDRGDLEGDPPTVDLVRSEVELREAADNDPLSTRASAEQLAAGDDPLADRRHAEELIRSVFDRVSEVEDSGEGGPREH